MSVDERFAKLEEDVKELESRMNFRLLLVALGALIAALIAISGLGF